jgi:hypothetical protein
LEAVLGLPLDRYEAVPGHAPNYAQIDIPEGADYWANAHRLLEPIHHKLEALRSNGSIASMSIDAALPLRNDALSASALIPAAFARLAGQAGIDLEISIYRSI